MVVNAAHARQERPVVPNSSVPQEAEVEMAETPEVGAKSETSSEIFREAFFAEAQTTVTLVKHAVTHSEPG